MYKYIDDHIDEQKEKYDRLFQNKRLEIQKFDRLNNVRNVNDSIRKSGKALYNRLREEDIYFFEEVMFDCLKDEYELSDKEDMEEFLALIGFSLLEFLDLYNKTLLYVYENEVERKQDRYIEGMIALVKSKIQEKIDFTKQQERYWNTMLEEVSVDLEREVMLASFNYYGVTKVQWVTMGDTKVCAECRENDGKIFDIDKLPSRPHIHCRCEFIPVYE